MSAELDEGDILKISGKRIGDAEIEGEFEFYEGAVVQDLLDEIVNAYDGGISLSLDREAGWWLSTLHVQRSKDFRW